MLRVMMIMCVVIAEGCAIEVPNTSTAIGETRCNSGECTPGDDDGGNYVDPTSAEAQPTVYQLGLHTTEVARACRWRTDLSGGTCLLCWAYTRLPYADAYACQVCSNSSGNRCGDYNTTLDDWAIA